MNRTFILGHLGRDPEVRTSSRTQTTWATLSVATSRSRRQGDEWVEETDWHRVKVFGETAELCQRFLRKGSPVLVEGSVIYDTWTDREGNRRHSTVIMADRVEFVGGRERRDDPEPAPIAMSAK